MIGCGNAGSRSIPGHDAYAGLRSTEIPVVILEPREEAN